jgi:hypothetical protein
MSKYNSFKIDGKKKGVPMNPVFICTPIYIMGFYQKYVQNDSKIDKGVKLHSKFRSFSLAHRNEPYYKGATFVQKRWRNGFRIDSL